MRPRDFLLAIAALMAVVVFAPIWITFLGNVNLGAQSTWIASLALPALLALFLTSWIRPQATTPVLGVFVLAGAMVLAPQVWSMVELGAAISPEGGLAGPLFTLAAPLLVAAFALAIGWRRMQA